MFPTFHTNNDYSISHPVPRGDFQAGAGGPAGPSGSGRPQEGRGGRKRGSFVKNIVPVDVKTIRQYREQDGPLMIHGIEVSLIKLVVQLRHVERGNLPESISFIVEDDTGRTEAIQYPSDQENIAIPVQNTFVHIIGALKIGPEENMVKVYKLWPVQSMLEVDAHHLEMAVLPLRMAKYRDQAASLAQNSFNSFFQPGGAGSGVGPVFRRNHLIPDQRSLQSNTNTCFTPPVCPDTARVLSSIRTCLTDVGISRRELYNIHRAEMSESKVEEMLDFLTNEGHIYTTMDQHHFKSTDS